MTTNTVGLGAREAGRVGDWMQTFSGKVFWPLDPRPEEIDVIDVAHALSMLCRYGGHTARFYSVAEHCVLVSRAVPPQLAFAGLMHDATEAYLIDLPRPIKRSMPSYAEAEARLWTAFAERFDLPADLPAEVLAADNRILLDERAALMQPPPRDWSIDGLTPLGVTIAALSPYEAKVAWLEQFNGLA